MFKLNQDEVIEYITNFDVKTNGKIAKTELSEIFKTILMWFGLDYYLLWKITVFIYIVTIALF